MSSDAAVFIISGLTIIIIGFILQEVYHGDASYLYGWGCCDLYWGITKRNQVFVNKN